MALPLPITPRSVRLEMSGVGMSVYLSMLGDEATQDEVITERIIEAQSELEDSLGMYLFHETIKSLPVAPGLVRGTDYTKVEDAYPFFARDWQGTGKVRARRRPIVSVQRVAIRYGQGPQVLDVVEYPENWISVEGRLGVVNVLPVIGAVKHGAGALIMLPMTGGALRRASLPSLVTLDYVAGFLPRDFDPAVDDPREASPDFNVVPLLKAVRLLAVAATLQGLERAVGAGGGSISMFGLSESFQAGRFAAEIDRYKSAAEELKEQFVAAFCPPQIFSF